MRKSISIGILMVALILSSTFSALAAPVQVVATIENGSGGGFGYSTVHSADNCTPDGLCKSGTRLLDNIGGELTFIFNDMGGFSMTNIMGDLTGDEGTLKITGGSISDSDDTTSFASGSVSYELELTSGSGMGTNNSGTFYFEAQSFSSPLGSQAGPNNINADNFWLWGNNWDVDNGGNRSNVSGGIPLGLDLKGGNFVVTGPAVPAPSAMLLMGSGLFGLVAWRMKKSA